MPSPARALTPRALKSPRSSSPPWKSKSRRLVLLDLMLPEEDGLSVLKRFRAAPATRHVPVIILSAKDTEFDKVLGLDSGADDYLPKPFGMLELFSRIRAVLRRSQQALPPREYRAGALLVRPPSGKPW